MKSDLKIKCSGCGGVGKSKCAKCENVYYCSRECQVKDWKIHKSVCDREKSPHISVTMKSFTTSYSKTLEAHNSGGNAFALVAENDGKGTTSTSRYRLISEKLGEYHALLDIDKASVISHSQSSSNFRKDMKDMISGSLPMLSKVLGEEAKRAGKMICKYFLIYRHDTPPSFREKYFNPFFTGALMASPRYPGALYLFSVSSMGGVGGYIGNVRGLEGAYLMINKQTHVYGKHRGGHDKMLFGSINKVYEVVQPESWTHLGYRGLPDMSYGLLESSVCTTCCRYKEGETRRIVGCPCLRSLCCTQECAWKFISRSGDHSLESCLNLAKTVNPVGLEDYRKWKNVQK